MKRALVRNCTPIARHRTLLIYVKTHVLDNILLIIFLGLVA